MKLSHFSDTFLLMNTFFGGRAGIFSIREMIFNAGSATTSSINFEKLPHLKEE